MPRAFHIGHAFLSPWLLLPTPYGEHWAAEYTPLECAHPPEAPHRFHKPSQKEKGSLPLPVFRHLRRLCHKALQKALPVALESPHFSQSLHNPVCPNGSVSLTTTPLFHIWTYDRISSTCLLCSCHFHGLLSHFQCITGMVPLFLTRSSKKEGHLLLCALALFLLESTTLLHP